MNIEFTNYILEGGFPLTIKYDEVESKKSLNGDKKYYLTDLSFYFTTNTDNRINYT